MFDVIGDIHGHADELEALLKKMGYKLIKGVYQHPEKRKVAFVGDFIDRGPKIREVLHIVKNMCDAGHAVAVMGNHEYNAICYHTKKPSTGEYFRKHGEKEIKQHEKTVEQFENYQSEWLMFFEWFKSLPLYYENEEFRMVHACWDEEHISWIKSNYKGISIEFLQKANDKKSNEYNVIEETLKGKESSLPDGLFFHDKDGAKRHECRVRWWADDKNRITFGQMMMECPDEILEVAIPSGTIYHSYNHEKPVFFGHYWLKDQPMLENPKAICLDYSVAKKGMLVGCRLVDFDGDLEMEFVY